MDPFSLAVGVAGLVGLVAKTIDISTIFVKEARLGQEAAAELLKELDILSFNLQRLDEFLRTTDQLRGHFSDTSVLVSSTFTCRTKITVLYDKLSRAKINRFGRLTWPLEAKEHHETKEALRAYTQCCQFSLTISGCMLLSNTSTEVQNILKQQLETFQLLDKFDLQARSLERSLAEQTEMQKKTQAADERVKVLEWISRSPHEERHHDVRSQRMEGTGQWFLDERLYQRWRDDPQLHGNTLLCQGIQGSGKSVLTSLVVDQLREYFDQQKVAVLHLYFNYREQADQSTEKVLASLLKQLAIARQQLPKPIFELYRKFKAQERRPQLQDLEQAFSLTCQSIDRVFVIVDALDECDTKNRKAFLRSISNLQDGRPLSIFMTSRSYEDYVNQLFGSCPRIKIEAHDSDLRAYVCKEVETNSEIDGVDEIFNHRMIERVVQGAQNMFLLAVLQIQSILSEPTVGEMQRALDAMPRGLEEAFEETLLRIRRQPEGRRKLGMNTLMWITHAKRPLLVSELSDALAVRPGATTLNPLYRPSQKLMVDSCLGLVTINEESSVIRLVHFSVQEFFESHRHRIFPLGESTIAELTTTYSLLDDFSQGSCQVGDEIQSLISQNPFVAYAACFWGHHVRDVSSPMIDEIALKLLRAGPHKSCSYQIQRYTAGFRELYWDTEVAKTYNGLMMAATFGLEILGKKLLHDNEVQVNATSKIGTTALIQAAANGHTGFMRILLGYGADPLMENWYGNALHCAAEAGRVEALRELLQGSLEVNIRDRRGRTALHCATENGHIAAIRTLLAGGADINAKFQEHDQGYTALRYAIVLEQSAEVVKTLLMSGANTEIRDQHSVTPLHDAAALALEETVLLLLDFGANIHARTVHGNTALHIAALRNHVDVVHILLDHGAEINARTVDGVTALFMAAERGGEASVRALISSGADIEAEDNEGTTALHVAMKENHRNIVQVLLEAGASTNTSNNDGGTASGSAGEDSNLDTDSTVARNNAKRKAFDSSGEYEEEAALTLMTYRFKSRDMISKSEQRCTECDKSFERPCDLTKHQKTHSRPWKCSEPQCKYHEHGWPTEKERDRHFNDKHCSIPHKFNCQYPDCSYTSKRESNLKQHMERAHDWVYHRSRNVKRLKTSSIPTRSDSLHWRDGAMPGPA